MKLLDRIKSSGSAADELAALVERWTASQAERDQLAAAVEQAKVEREDRLGGLADDLGLGKIDVEDYERQKAESELSLADAEEALTRSEAVIEALGKRAAVLEAEIAQGQEDEIRAALDVAQSNVANLEAKLASARRLAEELDVQLEDAIKATSDAGERFDPERRRAAEQRRRYEDRIARDWAASRPHRLNDPPPKGPPRHLRARALEYAEQFRRESEAERAALSERSRREMAALGVSEEDRPRADYRSFDRL